MFTGSKYPEKVSLNFKVTSLVQGYGLTESCGASLVANPLSPEENHTVGIPVGGLEMRLEAVPELGYDPLGNPPRGEVCMRGPVMFTGYYKRPELTAGSVGVPLQLTFSNSLVFFTCVLLCIFCT